MTGKIADLSEEDRALLTEEEIAAWEENDEEEAREETDEEREAREQEEADQQAEDEAAQAEAERVRLEAEKTAGTEAKPDPKKPAAKEPEKTPEELEAEAAAAAEAEAAPEPVARKPRPLFKADVPADLAEQFTALDTKEDALTKQFDEGELTTLEYETQKRAINKDRRILDRIELKAELAAESMQSRNEESWDDVTAAFFDEHPDILKSTGKLAALNQFVMQETAKTMDAGKTAGRADLDRAYKLYCADMGIEPSTTEQTTAAKGKLPTKPKNVPPTLRNVPASETADTDDGKFAFLDKLNGEDFERALEKLTPSEQAAYYAS